MEISLLFGGFGGQGVQTIGKLLTYAGCDADLNVTFSPSYGGEMRGGTSNCTVSISPDKEIASPSKRYLDYVVAFNTPAYAKFKNQIKAGGTLVYNSDLVTPEMGRDDIRYLEIPLNTLTDKLGSQKVMNIVMLGFISQLFDYIPEEVFRATIKVRLGKKAEFIELNDKAFTLGVEYARKLLASNM